MDMLFFGYGTQGQGGTPVPVGYDFASRHNRDASPDRSQNSDTNEDDHDHNMSVVNQPESSTAVQGELQIGAEPRGLERCTAAIRRMSTNRDQTSMLFTIQASHYLLVSKLLPFLVTWTLMP